MSQDQKATTVQVWLFLKLRTKHQSQLGQTLPNPCKETALHSDLYQHIV